jgi:hypothetical protein
MRETFLAEWIKVGISPGSLVLDNDNAPRLLAAFRLSNSSVLLTADTFSAPNISACHTYVERQGRLTFR